MFAQFDQMVNALGSSFAELFERNIDIDEVAERKVIDFNKGRRRIPLVEIASEKGTQSLSVPSELELAKALK